MARSKTGALALILVLFVSASARALGPVESIRSDLGVIVQLNLDKSTQTAGLITNIMGVGVVLPFSADSRWSLEPTADLYWGYFALVGGKAVSTEIADRTSFVIGLLVNAPVVYSLSLGGSWAFGFGAGLAINARAGFQASSDAPLSDVSAINAYFWSQGRFLMPSTLLRAEYRLTQRIEFGFEALAYWPVFNLWAGGGLSFLDQGIFGGSLVIRYRL